MKLKNPKTTPVAVEMFLGPGDWFKAQVEAGGTVDVPDDLAAAIKAQCGLVDAPAPAKK